MNNTYTIHVCVIIMPLYLGLVEQCMYVLSALICDSLDISKSYNRMLKHDYYALLYIFLWTYFARTFSRQRFMLCCAVETQMTSLYRVLQHAAQSSTSSVQTVEKQEKN